MSEGQFRLTVTLPGTAVAGSYPVRAVGPEGVAIADLCILEGADKAAPAAEHEAAVGSHRTDSAVAIAGFASLAVALLVVAVVLLHLPGREGRAKGRSTPRRWIPHGGSIPCGDDDALQRPRGRLASDRTDKHARGGAA